MEDEMRKKATLKSRESLIRAMFDKEAKFQPSSMEVWLEEAMVVPVGVQMHVLVSGGSLITDVSLYAFPVEAFDVEDVLETGWYKVVVEQQSSIDLGTMVECVLYWSSGWSYGLGCPLSGLSKVTEVICRMEEA
jgi:hypothetical protein